MGRTLVRAVGRYVQIAGSAVGRMRDRVEWLRIGDRVDRSKKDARALKWCALRQLDRRPVESSTKRWLRVHGRDSSTRGLTRDQRGFPCGFPNAAPSRPSRALQAGGSPVRSRVGSITDQALVRRNLPSCRRATIAACLKEDERKSSSATGGSGASGMDAGAEAPVSVEGKADRLAMR